MLCRGRSKALRSNALSIVGVSNRRHSQEVQGSKAWETRIEAGAPGHDLKGHTSMKSLDSHGSGGGYHELKPSMSNGVKLSQKLSQNSLSGLTRTQSAVSNGPMLPSASAIGAEIYAVSNDSSDFAVEVSSGERFRNVVNSRGSTILSLISSGWTLVGRDMYLLLAESTHYDTVAYTISTVCMVILLLEIIVWTKVLRHSVFTLNQCRFALHCHAEPACFERGVASKLPFEYLSPPSLCFSTLEYLLFLFQKNILLSSF